MGACDEKGEGGKAMAMGIRVAGDEEGEGDEAGDGIGSVTKRAMALAARAMATRVADDCW